MRVCQNRRILFFLFKPSTYVSSNVLCCNFVIFILFVLCRHPISVYEPSRGSDSPPFVGILPCFLALAAIFLTLKAMAKKAKSTMNVAVSSISCPYRYKMSILGSRL